MTRRFLAPNARAGDGHGYLHQPARQYPQAPDPPETIHKINTRTNLIDEPEAPSRHWINAQADLAAEHNRLRRLLELELARADRTTLAPKHRIADCQRRAKRHHTNISGELFIIDKMAGRANTAAVTTKIEQLEARLDNIETPPS